MIDDNEVEWRLRAACIGMATKDFFPTRGTGGTAPRYIPQVRDACDRCDVRQHCLDDAIHGEHHLSHPVLGYRGGTTPEQRVEIHRQRGRRVSERQYRSRSRRHLITQARQAGVPVEILADAYGLQHQQVRRLASGG